MAALMKPKSFLRNAEGINAVYNYSDVVSGTGYITFYVGRTDSLDLLSNLTYYSKTIFTTSSNTTSPSFTKMLDLDFDAIINKAFTLKGKAIFNASFQAIGGLNVNYGTYVVAILKVVRNGTEITIATSPNSTQAISNDYAEASLSFDVPLTNIKIGDTLRLTIEAWVKSDGANQSSCKVSHDPKGRLTGWSADYPTNTSIQIPVRLEL
jgi:hypothetical protein